jgi:hypothetical protein
MSHIHTNHLQGIVKSDSTFNGVLQQVFIEVSSVLPVNRPDSDQRQRAFSSRASYRSTLSEMHPAFIIPCQGFFEKAGPRALQSIARASQQRNRPKKIVVVPITRPCLLETCRP